MIDLLLDSVAYRNGRPEFADANSGTPSLDENTKEAIDDETDVFEILGSAFLQTNPSLSLGEAL